LLTLFGVKVPRASSKFDLPEMITSRTSLRDGDVLVISSKYVAISEGRTISLARIRVGDEALELSKKYRIDRRLCELIVRESDSIVGGVPGFILTMRDGLLTPNAGIDKSNIEHGRVVLYPRRPAESATEVREAVRFRSGARVAVVVSDSRLMPTRRGTVGVALASAGLEGIADLRGKRDLFGNALKVTTQAIADDLCSASQLLMGESDEATPIVVVRGLRKELLREAVYETKRFAIPEDECVYIRSWKN